MLAPKPRTVARARVAALIYFFRSTPWAAPVFFYTALVVIDVAAVARQLLWEPRAVMHHVAHDPGKFLFGGCVLPIIIYLLFRGTDLLAFKRRPLLLIPPVFLVVLAAAVTVSDTESSVMDRLPSALDIGDPSKSSRLAREHRKRTIELANARKGLGQKQSGEVTKAPEGAQANRIDPIEDRDPITNRDGAVSEYTKLRTKLFGGDAAYGEQISFRLVVASALSFLGTVAAGFTLMLLTMRSWGWLKCSQRDLLLAVIMFTMWIPLRAYSEWHLRFQELRLADYPLLIVGGAASVSAATAVAVDAKRDVGIAIASTLSVTGSALGLLAPERVEGVAYGLADMPLVLLLALYVVGFLGLMSLLAGHMRRDM